MHRKAPLGDGPWVCGVAPLYFCIIVSASAEGEGILHIALLGSCTVFLHEKKHMRSSIWAFHVFRSVLRNPVKR